MNDELPPQSPCRKLESRLCPALIGTCGEICLRFDSDDEAPWAIEIAAAKALFKDVIQPDD